MRYAIGEIVLVVIGILIALSINNWNEERKDRNLENEILLEINHGLHRDLSDIKGNLNVHREIHNSQMTLINWIESNKPYHDSLARHFSIAHRVTQFISTDGPYENLKTLGIGIVQNDSLRNRITSVYDHQYDFYSEIEHIYTELIFHTIKFVNSPFFDATVNYDTSEPNLYGTMNLLDSIGIRESNEFKYQLKTNLKQNAILIDLVLLPTIANIEKLIELLLVEIEP